MKKLIIIVLVLAAVGAGAGAYYMRRGGPEPKVDTLPVTRGDVVDVVPATGTLEAKTTVNVGSQVSGMVKELYADYNSIVRKGQVIARLDPSLIQTQIETNRANVTRAEADIERLKVTLDDAKRKFGQAKQMWDKQLIPRDQLDTAEVNVRNLEVQIKSADAGLVQAKANLNTQQVNLQHTVIESPIDGIVISRQVEPGQTVAASMNAPTLFIIAEDLHEMQVLANIDEADVGRMRAGQPVNFRVDAYPTDQFRGTVEQVRLQPTTVQNVVTYSAVIAVPNPDLKLKPGMTANVTVEIARRSNVLRVPAAALRFRPTADHFAALNLPVPPEIQRGQGGFAGRGGRDGGRSGQQGQQGQGASPAGGGQSGQPGTQAPAGGGTQGASAPTGKPSNAQPPAQNQGQNRERDATSRGGGDRTREGGAAGATRGGQGGEGQNQGGGRGFGGGGRDPNMTPEERRKRMEERMANMTPEERERFQQRMREFQERGGRGGGPGGQGGQGANTGGGRGGDSGQRADRGNRQGQDQAPGRGRDLSQGMTRSVRAGSAITSNATTIDALFAPLPVVEQRRTVWVWHEKQLTPVQIRYGISDGTFAELTSGDLKEGQELVTNITTGLEQRTTPGQGGAQNPLMGPQRGRGGPGGGPGGGGGGRGGR
jgi:HlyD family secretion protein